MAIICISFHVLVMNLLKVSFGFFSLVMEMERFGAEFLT